ncbi:PDZ domain-containing protein, partial [Alphaproteobacteria bacterium]|nr:PDZ domain-containing protein [Alphaproteobacteria bacterium]
LEYQKGRIIITDVQAESAGYQLGFRKGDLLEEINDVPLKTLTDVRRSLKRSYFGWFITFSRNGTRQQLRIR